MAKANFRLFKILITSGTFLMLHTQAHGLDVSAVIKAMTGASEEAQIGSISADAAGAASGNLGHYEKKTADVLIAASGGSGFLSSETYTTNEFDESMAGMSIAAEKTSVGENADSAQFEHIYFLVKSQDNALQMLETKKLLQETSQTAYTTAAAAAMDMRRLEKKAFEECVRPIENAYSTCEPAQKAAQEANKALDDILEAREDSAQSSQGASHSKARRATSNSKIKALKSALQKAASDYSNEASDYESEEKFSEAQESRAKSEKCKSASDPLKACEELTIVLENNESFGFMPVISYNGPINNPIASDNPTFSRLLNFIIAEARAIDISAILGMGAETSAAFGPIAKEIGSELDTGILSPTKRIISFESLAIIAGDAAAATQAEIDQVVLSKQKTQDILRQMNGTTSVKKNNSLNFFQFIIPTASAATSDNKKRPAIDSKTGSNNLKLPCIASSGTTNCKAVTEVLPKSQGFSNMSPLVKSLSMQIADFSDSVNRTSGKLSPATIKKAKGIVAKQASIANYLKKRQSAELQLASSMGQRSTNYAIAESHLIGTFNSITSKVLKNKKLSPSGYLASYRGKVFSKTDATASAPPEKIKNKLPTVAEKEHTDFKSEDKNNLGKDELKKSEVVNYNIGKVDINTNTEDSIFTVISNRYLKSFKPDKSEK
ncbi:MAG: hypothetical protein WC635_07975 [Bacteriovorax sp.]|jgi:hypothetical protein